MSRGVYAESARNGILWKSLKVLVYSLITMAANDWRIEFGRGNENEIRYSNKPSSRRARCALFSL